MSEVQRALLTFRSTFPLDLINVQLAVLSEGMRRETQGRATLAADINAEGSALRKKTVDAETTQTGLKHDVLEPAQEETQASPCNLAYTIHARGGDVRLKFFGARETKAGVMAHQWNSPSTYAGAFTRGGRWPARVSLEMGVAALKRVGKSRLSVKAVRSGLYITKELVKGRAAQTFETGSAAVLAGLLSRIAATLP